MVNVIQNMLSPMSPIFAPIQQHLAHLQVDRRSFTYVRELGEGAFGEASTLYSNLIFIVDEA